MPTAVRSSGRGHDPERAFDLRRVVNGSGDVAQWVFFSLGRFPASKTIRGQTATIR